MKNRIQTKLMDKNKVGDFHNNKHQMKKKRIQSLKVFKKIKIKIINVK